MPPNTSPIGPPNAEAENMLAMAVPIARRARIAVIPANANARGFASFKPCTKLPTALPIRSNPAIKGLSNRFIAGRTDVTRSTNGDTIFKTGPAIPIKISFSFSIAALNFSCTD